MPAIDTALAVSYEPANEEAFGATHRPANDTNGTTYTQTYKICRGENR